MFVGVGQEQRLIQQSLVVLQSSPVQSGHAKSPTTTCELSTVVECRSTEVGSTTSANEATAKTRTINRANRFLTIQRDVTTTCQFGSNAAARTVTIRTIYS